MTYYVLPEEMVSTAAPVGAATAANQVLQLAQETAISGKLPATLGQKTKALSLAVTLASDEDALPVTVALGATSANQATEIASLSSIDTKLTSQATATKQDTGNASLSSIDTKLTSQATSANQTTTNTKLDSIISNSNVLGVVDMLDTPFLDASGTPIPASASNSLQVVASTAAVIKKVQSVEDIGEFIGLYSGPVAGPTLICVMPLGGGEVNVNIPAGTLLSLRNMKNAAISLGNMAINFLG